MNLVLIGAPGSGKGTLANALSKKFNLVHISTGDLLRDEINNQTKLGVIAKELIKKGDFVSDDLIIKMVENRLREKTGNGFILDGFPRTINQFNIMDKSIKIDKAIYLDVDQNTIIERLSSRLICPICKTVYSSKKYYKDYCENCGTKLQIREDDNIDSIQSRLTIFENQTKPIVDCFRKQNKLLVLEGDISPEETLRKVEKALNEVKN